MKLGFILILLINLLKLLDRRVDVYMKGGKFDESKQLVEQMMTQLYLQGSTEANEQLQKVEMINKKIFEEE